MMIQNRQESRDEKSISPTCLRTFIGHTGSVEFVGFCPDGKFIYSGSDDYTIRVWEAGTGLCIKIFKLSQYYGDERHCFALSSDGKFVLVGNIFSLLEVLDLETKKWGTYFEKNDKSSISVALSHDNRYAVSGSHHAILLWDVTTRKCLKDIELQPEVYIQSVALTSDAKFILAAVSDETLGVWSIKTGECVKLLYGHGEQVNSVAISRDDKYGISAADDNTLRLWDLETGKSKVVFEGHSHCVNAVALSPDGKHILSGSVDKTIRLWNAETGKCISVINGHDGYVESVAFSSDGRYILSGGFDETIRLWRI